MPPAKSAKKQSLTLAQLGAYDDILTDALVDHTFYWTTIPKNRPSYHPSRGIKQEEITKIIQQDVIIGQNLKLAEAKLLATDGLKKFYNSLRTPKEKEDFAAHLRRYLAIYLPDCPFEVNATNRYTIFTHEASVTARRPIRRNDTIKGLCGIQVVITPEEEEELSQRKKDFSIVVSSRNKCTSLFMGPARFANHDCGANARLKTTDRDGMEVQALRSIDFGEEITVTYGDNYFGENNRECLCRTCELARVNGWAAVGEDGAPLEPSIEEDLSGFAAPYSLRSRRRDDSASRAMSRTPSVTPDIRPRISRTRSKVKPAASDRASTADSTALETPGSLFKRKRDSEALATPPVTPAKRQKTARSSMSLVLDSQGSGLSSVAHALSSPPQTSSEGSRQSSVFESSESGGADPVLTDATTPEEGSPDIATDPTSLSLDETSGQQGSGPIIHSPKPVHVKRTIQVLKQESDTMAGVSEALGRTTDGASALPTPSTDSGSPPSSAAEGKTSSPLMPPPPRPAGDSLSVSPRIMTSDLLPMTPTEAVHTTENPQAIEQITAEHAAAIEQTHVTRTEAQGGVVEVAIETITKSTTTTTTTVTATTEPDTAPARKKQRGGARRSSVAAARLRTEEAHDATPANQRIPGDYTLTPVLLSEPMTAWVHCINCATAFVQRDAYYTRASCPRCERHSMLYGYVWPKTEPEGPNDAEERVTDHRTVHRFLDPEDEAKVRGRQPAAWRKAAAEAAATTEAAAAAKAASASNATRGKTATTAKTTSKTTTAKTASRAAAAKPAAKLQFKVSKGGSTSGAAKKSTGDGSTDIRKTIAARAAAFALRNDKANGSVLSAGLLEGRGRGKRVVAETEEREDGDDGQTDESPSPSASSDKGGVVRRSGRTCRATPKVAAVAPAS